MPPISDDDPIRDLEKKMAAMQPNEIIGPIFTKKEDTSEKPLHLPKSSYGGAGFAFTVIGCGGLGYAGTYFFDLPFGFLIGLGVGFVIALWDLKNSI